MDMFDMLNMLVWIALGVVLAIAGITVLMWQFWAIMLLTLLGQLLMFFKGLN